MLDVTSETIGSNWPDYTHPRTLDDAQNTT